MKPGEITGTQIASRTESTSFTFATPEFGAYYQALLPATLVLKDVKKNEEYVYTLTVMAQTNLGFQQLSDQVAIVVVGKYRMMLLFGLIPHDHVSRLRFVFLLFLPFNVYNDLL